MKEKVEKTEKKNDEATKMHNVDISKMKKQDESIKELQTILAGLFVRGLGGRLLSGRLFRGRGLLCRHLFCEIGRAHV